MRRIALLALLLVVALSALPTLVPAQPASAAPPSQLPAVDAKIQIVWPHDAQGRPAPVQSAPLVNVEVYLFERGTMNPILCNFPNQVILRAAGNGLTAPRFYSQFLTHDYPTWPRSFVGQRVIRTVDGKTFPVWLFNDVPTGLGVTLELPKTYFMVDVVGADVRSNVWSHAADPRTNAPQRTPATAVGSATPGAADAVIQIVWPHDAQGNFQEVARADLVNVNAAIFHHPESERVSVAAGLAPAVRLFRSLNTGYLEEVKRADGVVTINSGAASWPEWVFNDVNVSAARDPVNKYYFLARVDGVETHTTIWAHGADPRTYFPQRDVPARSCSDAPATTDRVKIFLVALEDNGQSGEPIGCGDSIIPVEQQIEPTPAPLRAALERLLSIKDQFFGQSGLYNALYQSNLRVDNVTIENRKAIVHLSGTLTVGGVCDSPRVLAQLEETALQFETVDDVDIFVNGTPLEQLLSQR